MGGTINFDQMPWDWIGGKLNQFGRWLGDVTGANVGNPIDPAQFAPDLTNYNADRANQMALYEQLRQQSLGNGPSLAQGQLQQATDQNIRQAMALGAAQQGQGLGYASALRSIADQSAAARQQAAGQSALIRNMEMQQALQQMQGLGGQMMAGGLQASGMGQQGQQFGANLEFQRQAQEAANRRMLTGQVLNAAGGVGGLLFSGGKGGGGGGGGLLNAAGAGYGVPAMSTGGVVPGRAPGRAMDSTSNDTVPTMLSPGEVVLPRSITMAEDAPERAEAFVRAIMERRKRGPPDAGQHVLRQEASRKRAA